MKIQNQPTAALRKRRSALLRRLPPLQAILRGSLIERYKRCGKPGCKCADGPGHGPKYYLSVSYPGLRPQMDYVPQESHTQIAEFVANYHRAREILEAISEITEQHRSRPAYIYVRQSTNAQVLHHQESTERQYALRTMALELGWSESAIRTLDRDLGMTGTEMTRREDFKTLVADVSMGQVGAVFALEVSRLARSNLDWHRLLELCAFTATLVIDEDGCYDPADFNDGLLLGLKGTMAQAELHFLRARLQGGKLHKAKKGELRFPLPVGFCYDAESR